MTILASPPMDTLRANYNAIHRLTAEELLHVVWGHRAEELPPVNCWETGAPLGDTYVQIGPARSAVGFVAESYFRTQVDEALGASTLGAKRPYEAHLVQTVANPYNPPQPTQSQIRLGAMEITEMKRHFTNTLLVLEAIRFTRNIGPALRDTDVTAFEEHFRSISRIR